MTRRASSSRVGFGPFFQVGLFARLRHDPIVGMSYFVGGCNPGEFTHSSKWVAVSACRAFRSKSSLTGPDGSLSARFLASFANEARRSFRDIDCLKRRRFSMTASEITGPNRWVWCDCIY
jgi:hypothetical protein